MFSIEEVSTWSAEDVLVRIRKSIPNTWSITHSFSNGWHSLLLLGEEGVVQWSGEHVDQKILFLDALGSFQLRSHKLTTPAWKPRDREVALYRPSEDFTAVFTPDPADLDPDEVAAVYKEAHPSKE